jgi:site-specific DNA recombinase
MYNNDLSRLKFGLYARKSGEGEDRQVQSIPDQIKIMRDIARQHGLTIVEEAVLEEAKSAKVPGQRPVFDQFIGLIERGVINGALTWKSNRLARNPKESGIVQQLLIDEKIGAIVTDGKVYMPEDNAVIFSVDASMDTQFSRDLMKLVRRGMYSKAERGWFPGVPPIGYLNYHDTVLGKIIAYDPDRFALVRKLWDLMLTGAYSVSEIARIAEQDGLKTIVRRKSGGYALSVAGVYAMFHNPFYYGEYPFGGKWCIGKHKAMITKEEFDRVQDLIGVGNRQRPDVERAIDYYTAYRGLIECGECGCIVTYARKVRQYKNGNSQAFEYCYCTNRRQDYDCSNKRKIKPEAMAALIRDELSKYTIIDDFFQYACKYLNEWNDEQEAKAADVHKNQEKAIKAVETEIYGLQRMLYTGRCDDKFFDVENAKLEQQLKDLQTSTSKHQERSRLAREKARKFFTFARYAKEDFDSDSDERKRSVLAQLGERLVYVDGQVFIKPIKYLQPVLNTKAAMEAELERVRTLPQQIQKTSFEALIQSWYT